MGLLPVFLSRANRFSLVFSNRTTLPSYFTYARPDATTCATVFNSAGVLQTVAANVPRFDFDPVTLAPQGILIEPAATNIVLYNNDLTNAAWISVGITAAKDQTGIDGIANSASSLTATGANGTCLQTIILASSARVQSCYIKRITGSGTVQMTTDGGATWTTVTVTSTWTRVSLTSATVINPAVGFKIVTSGDKVAIQYVQNETGILTSAIATTSVAVTRSADHLYTTSLRTVGFNALEGTIYARCRPASTNSFSRIIDFADNATPTNAISMQRNTTGLRGFITTAGSQTAAMLVAGWNVSNGMVKTAMTYKLNNASLVLSGGTPQLDTSCTIPTGITRLTIGAGYGGASGVFNGWISEFRYYPKKLSDAKIISITT